MQEGFIPLRRDCREAKTVSLLRPTRQKVLTQLRKVQIVRLPAKRKSILPKSWRLNTVCPKYGFSVSLDKIMRVDSDRIECPACHEKFIPKTAGWDRDSSLHGLE